MTATLHCFSTIIFFLELIVSLFVVCVFTSQLVIIPVFPIRKIYKVIRQLINEVYRDLTSEKVCGKFLL